MFSLYVAPLLVMTAPAESEKTLFWPLQPFTHRNNHARYSVKNNVMFPGLIFSGPDDVVIYRLDPVFEGASSGILYNWIRHFVPTKSGLTLAASTINAPI